MEDRKSLAPDIAYAEERDMDIASVGEWVMFHGSESNGELPADAIPCKGWPELSFYYRNMKTEVSVSHG